MTKSEWRISCIDPSRIETRRNRLSIERNAVHVTFGVDITLDPHAVDRPFGFEVRPYRKGH